MKVLTPEISWHNREAILSIHIHKCLDGYKIATGGIEKDIKNPVRVEFLSNLERHQSAVNILRFSPDSALLASGDSEGVVNIWKQSVSSAPDIFSTSTISKNDDESLKNVEIWLVQYSFRDHRSDSDVCDLCWSPDSKFLLSGSTDCSLIIFDVSTGKRQNLIQENDKRFPVGVCWDPKSFYFVSLSNDRFMNVYSTEKCHRLFSITNGEIPSFFDPSKKLNFKLFHDSSLMSYVRRPSFTPGGDLFIAPAGCIEEEKTNHFCTYIFSRHNLKKPLIVLPSPKEPTIVVSCCPVLFKLKQSSCSMFALPYRSVFAVLTKKSVVLYDTQHPVPIGYVSDIHYVSLTDCSWSEDGKMLVVSSEDGYCTTIVFDDDELGEIYDENFLIKPSIDESPKQSIAKTTLKTIFEKNLGQKTSISTEIKIVEPQKSPKRVHDKKPVDKVSRRVIFTTIKTPILIQNVPSDVDMKEQTSSKDDREGQKIARRVNFVTLAQTPIGQDIVEKAVNKR